MIFDTNNLQLWGVVTYFVVVLVIPSFALNSDGILLLSFKNSILSDPESVLKNWNYNDNSPCSWNGITCREVGSPQTLDMFRVTKLVLPNSQLLGSIPADLGLIQHLGYLDLSNNSFNGSLPNSIFNASKLQFLSLSNNVISGELPENIGGMTSLKLLNLSDNALTGKIPENLTDLQNLTVVSLRGNSFSGNVPSGFKLIELLDLSSNRLNGSLPSGFGGNNLRYLNLSNNNISASISPNFANKIPTNATIDLSFNNLTGSIPKSPALLSQKTDTFAGNINLCGKPLKILCSIPSTLSTHPPNISSTFSPAIAAFPKRFNSTLLKNASRTPKGTQNQQQSGLKPITIAEIAIGDLAGICILTMTAFLVYQMKKRKTNILSGILSNTLKATQIQTTKQHPESKKPSSCPCLTNKCEETSTSESTSSDSDNIAQTHHNQGSIVAVDGETELDLETLLKASAYILGSSGESILYKAVLENGTVFAVRRMGETAIANMKDFENQVKNIARFRHPNLVRVRGFYWGDYEKLVINDYVSNGNLASAINGYRKRGAGASSSQLTLEARLKIAKGVARGLTYIHDKKHVHGNIKPSNILLNSDLEPIISDFGLDRLISGTTTSNSKSSNSDRNFGSHRSTGQDLPATGSSSTAIANPYQAPESLQNLKPNPKWDVYSFGVVLLELLTRRVFSDKDLGQWIAAGSVVEEKNRVLRMADVAIRADVEATEDGIILALFKLGINCASIIPQKRPSMKEAFQVLEKISC